MHIQLALLFYMVFATMQAFMLSLIGLSVGLSVWKHSSVLKEAIHVFMDAYSVHGHALLLWANNLGSAQHANSPSPASIVYRHKHC